MPGPGHGSWEGSVTGGGGGGEEEGGARMWPRSLPKVPEYLAGLFLRSDLGRRVGFIYSYFMHSFITLKKKSFCCVFQIVLGLGYTSVNKIARFPCLQAASVARGKADNRQNTYNARY